MSSVSLSQTRQHVISVLAQRIADGCFSERMLAKRSGLKQTYVHRILAGTRRAADEIMDILARVGHVYPAGDARNDWDPTGWWLKHIEDEAKSEVMPLRHTLSLNDLRQAEITEFVEFTKIR